MSIFLREIPIRFLFWARPVKFQDDDNDNFDDDEYDETLDDDDPFSDNEWQAEEATEPPNSAPISSMTKYKWDNYGTRSRVEESRRQQLHLKSHNEGNQVLMLIYKIDNICKGYRYVNLLQWLNLRNESLSVAWSEDHGRVAAPG